MAEEQKDLFDYDVGYRKPPKQNQFQPGKSGNPQGRPKGSKNLATIVLQEARKPVRVNGPRGARTVTKVQATLMQLANQSAQGNPGAQRHFLALVKDSEESLSADHSVGLVHESDQIVMRSILRRMREYKPTEDAADANSVEGDAQ